MNLIKTSRTLAAIAFATLGFSSTSQAAVNAFFSAGSTCTGATSALFSPAGPTVQVSLCMTTTSPTATCGHTIVLQSAVGESGRFLVTSPVTLGAGYSDPNSEVAQLPLAINNPHIVADLGGTGSIPVPSTANQLLATFNLAPQSNATNASYVISLNNVSAVAVDADGTCGATTVPSDAVITASFTLNRNNAPVFTSAGSTTFSTTGANSFTVAATGNPVPTLSSGTLPSGVLFNTGNGLLSGTPAPGGPYVITFTASNTVMPNATQTFTLNAAGQASQTINFTNPGTQTFSASTIPLNATATPSMLSVSFSSITTAVCTVTGSNVTMVALGTCTISANQAGNSTYLPATASQSFGIVGGVPGAPVIGSATAGNAQATISFTPPASSGGSVISTYAANCISSSSSGAASGNASPITVTGLSNGVLYTCSVNATNALGTGPASNTVTVTPVIAPLSLVGVVSRKVHGSSGTFSLPITTGVAIAGAVTVESRLIGTGHSIVFQFSEAITSVGTASAVDGASATVATGIPTSAGNEITVILTGVADRSRVTVTLANVNGTGAAVTFPVSLGFMVGDQNGSYFVDGGDISAIRARSGQTTTTLNFRGDFNSSGAIDGGDISTVRARSGNNLP